MLLAVPMAVPPSKQFCWRTVKATLTDTQEFYVGLYSFEEVQSWTAGLASRLTKNKEKINGVVESLADPGRHAMMAVDAKFCSITLLPSQAERCGNWQTLRQASFIMLGCGISVVKLFLVGALYGCCCANRSSLLPVKVCYGLAPVVGLMGIASYSVMTLNFYDDRGLTFSVGYWLAMCACLLSAIPIILLGVQKKKDQMFYANDEINTYGSI
eukprot:TRINITY_DN3549_c0_g2_i2.p1 TRINITY_DN3549_c0_g2~~TRINITY_DN3549_c0_g2_i2.p1  ORF type:complete len:250 (-),score=27.54 TRINITY_DN3549_c0_g2_i2:370-1008(-)